MFWIASGEELIHALHKGWPSPVTQTLHEQFDHVDWVGLRFYDMIFPWFIFMVGVSIVFSLTRLVEQSGRGGALKRVLTRTTVMYLIGVVLYGGIAKGFDEVRWLGVLQRIAICYGVAGALFCLFRLRTLVAICVALLVSYWALVMFVPIRDFNLSKASLSQAGLAANAPETRERFLNTTATVRGSFDDGRTLPQHLDFMYLPGYKWDGAYDPEGLLSTLPAVATCLIGVFAGVFIRNSRKPDSSKVLWLVSAGIACMLMGYLWGLQFPLIKKIWTSSYALVVCGWASVALGLFYWVIEIRGWKGWCIPFVWIGTNALTVYIVFHIVDFRKLAERIVGGPVQTSLGQWGPMLLACVWVGLVLALARFLYTRKLFLRL